MNIWNALDCLQSGRYDDLEQHFNKLFESHAHRKISDHELLTGFTLARLARTDAIPCVQAWIAKYPNSVAANQSLLSLYVEIAQQICHTPIDHTVSGRQVSQMREYFLLALPLVEKLMGLSPRPVLALVAWRRMDRTMLLQQDLFDFCSEYDELLSTSILLCETHLWALNPKWTRDEDAMSEFMQEARTWPWNQVEREALEAAYLLQCAEVHRRTDEQSDALLCAHRAANDYHSRDAFATLAELYLDLGDHVTSLVYCHKALQQYETADRFFIAGTVLMAMQRTDDGIVAWEHALALGYGIAAYSLAQHFAVPPYRSGKLDHIQALLDQGVTQHSARCMSLLGYLLLDASTACKRDLARAQSWLNMAADWGDSDAHVCLARMYLCGDHGTHQDMSKAFAHAQAAYELGNADLMGELACMYFNGIGTQIDYEEALPLLRLAALEDQAEPMACLIEALWEGLGTPRDQAYARTWLNRLNSIAPEKYQHLWTKLSIPRTHKGRWICAS